MQTESDQLTTAEAAELLGITIFGVAALCRKYQSGLGGIRCVKQGNGHRASYMISRADIEEYLATRHKPGWPKGRLRGPRKSDEPTP